ncbi:uncharacterized protein L203_101388 [Cryptococcus depauperatus CBS 7841]|uniref:Uncharacterized protein n=1 Tax=Cryptococcus depauperatus CBS 7841 TaxID=1295531 RepID=A0AAJ8JPP6_9TREE
MSSLQIGSFNDSQSLTQHGPSSSHLPVPSTFSHTRKRRRITNSNPSAIPKGPENPPQSSSTNADWHNDGTDRILSSLSLLLDWLLIPGWIQEGIGLPQGKRMHHISDTFRYTKQNNTPSFGLDQGPRLEEWDWKWTRTRDVMDNVRMICPEWDTVDPIFRDRDGGSIALRSDSTRASKPVLRALKDQPLNSPQTQLPASAGPTGSSQASPSLSPSIQSPPRSLFATHAGSSPYYDSTSHIRRATRLETHSMSDRHNGRSTDDVEFIISQAIRDFFDQEDEWRNCKIEYMRQTDRYRQEKLALMREETKALEFQTEMNVAIMIMNRQPELTWEEAIEKTRRLRMMCRESL